MLRQLIHTLILTTSLLIHTGCNNNKQTQKDLPAADSSAVTETYQPGANDLFFESTSANANKRTILTEYIRLTFRNSIVEGKSAGWCEGSPDWTTEIHGAVNDTIIDLRTTYREGDSVLFRDLETWRFEKDKTHLFRDDSKALNNLYGAKEYHRIEWKEIPKEYAEQIRNTNVIIK